MFTDVNNQLQRKGLNMNKVLREFYSSSQTYLEILKKHDENSFAEYIKLCKTKIPSGASILECGCGVGFSSYLLAKEGFKVTATDISPLFISEAKKKYHNQSGLKYFVEDASNISFSDQSFDAVGSIAFIEHVTDVKKTLKEMWRILRKEGILILPVPNFLDPVPHLITFIKWKAKNNYKPWEPKTRIGAFYQFIRITFLRILKAARINKTIYFLKPILSDEKDALGEDFDATWLANWFDVKNILNELGFSIQVIFPEDPRGKTIQVMEALKLPKRLQSSYKKMRASGCFIVGIKK